MTLIDIPKGTKVKNNWGTKIGTVVGSSPISGETLVDFGDGNVRSSIPTKDLVTPTKNLYQSPKHKIDWHDWEGIHWDIWKDGLSPFKTASRPYEVYYGTRKSTGSSRPSTPRWSQKRTVHAVSHRDAVLQAVSRSQHSTGVQYLVIGKEDSVWDTAGRVFEITDVDDAKGGYTRNQYRYSSGDVPASYDVRTDSNPRYCYPWIGFYDVREI